MTISRSDGTYSWAVLRKDIEDHDLAHYAVEQRLALTSSFFGLIEQGADIQDFESKDKQPTIGVEAKQVEFLVNLLQTENRNTGKRLDIMMLLERSLCNNGLPMMTDLNIEILDEIRMDYASYIQKLELLQPGERFLLPLTFLKR